MIARLSRFKCESIVVSSNDRFRTKPEIRAYPPPPDFPPPYPAPAPISRAAIALSFSSRAFRALSDSAVSCAVGGAAKSLARRSMMASTRSVAGLSPAMALAKCTA